MKVRDSGMPEEDYWESLFDVPLILDRLGVCRFRDVAELGCGYGTFTIPIAARIGGTLFAYDVEPDMLARTRQRAARLPVVLAQRDVVEQGFPVMVDAVLLFNILHLEDPVTLLRHAARALRPDGRVLVIHWRYGETPRGPSLDMRPRPEQVIDWSAAAGLCLDGEPIDLPPWHYGLRFQKT